MKGNFKNQAHWAKSGPRAVLGSQKQRSFPAHAKSNLATFVAVAAAASRGRLAVRWLPGFIIACLSTGYPIQAAQSTNAPVAPVSSRSDYSSFKLITERNIFNTRRSPRYVPPSQNSTATRPRNRSESFALVGTMRYDKGPFAFFDGNRSDYRKVLKPDDTIGGFKVAEILPSAVKLTSSTNEIELPVGMQLRREDESGEWVKSERPESAEPSGGFSGSSSRPSFQAAAPTPQPAPQPAMNADFPGAGPDGAPLPFNPDAVQVFLNGDGDQPPTPPVSAGANGPASAGTEGVTDPVMLRLMQRRAQERGN